MIDRSIFVCGCERSGTTMLGALLGAASGCVATPESQFKFDGINAISDELDTKTIYDLFVSSYRFKLWQVAPPSIKDIEGVNSLKGLLFLFVKEYAKQKGKNLDRLHTWVDHTPGNIDHIQRLYTEFPNSMFVHVIRDGRAVTASMKSLRWGARTAFDGADIWQKKVARGLAASHLNPSYVYTVRYEDLVLDPVHEMKNLCSFLGVDFEERIFRSNSFEVPEYTQSQHKLVGKKQDPDRISAWRSALSAREVEVFEYLTGDMLSSLGYEKVFSRPRRVTYPEWILFLIKAAEGKVATKLYQRGARKKFQS
ncbi:sulfotransferase family protein [Alkalilimnicola ehrlichii MLHE-1]|uniref:Sulfotransferase n=1 Tax=Alkalilimnicola ehrlichii (strain ATCC BAA-1101 / DSM 17681 / MLHE-1) TaxID=187272 RepID=Q0A669_ALKEH|nr:sulfotransferase [Alkalilimnicola ehrlichii]ABI57668.1 sulfotransferase [Alkalilimnicola ehrlichii MLHE-1]